MSNDLSDVLPEEIWDRAIGMMCNDAIREWVCYGDSVDLDYYVYQLTVNRAWAVSTRLNHLRYTRALT
jgi:hypothetical protein